LVLARAHVATKNGAIMISMGILNASANVVFNLILSRFLGLEGIALSTSCVHTAVAIVFWFRLESRIAELKSRPSAAPESEVPA
jgi:peptidoglycan biosynthesis protein MviN/MurJ (putative lipid II flippase)